MPIRELLKRGLAAEGFDLADFRNKSKEFGVAGNVKDYDSDDTEGGDEPLVDGHDKADASS